MPRVLDSIRARLRTGPSAPATRAPGVGEHPDQLDDVDDLFLARLRRISFASRRSLTSGLVGEHASPRKATALEFSDYRSYTPGDDFRRVDWNAYLRFDQLLVKLADAPERLGLQVLLDGSSSMDWGSPTKFRYAKRLAIGLSYIALSHMDTVDLMVLRGADCRRVSRQKSARAIPQLVKSVGALSVGGTTDLASALSSFARRGEHKGVAIVISDLLSPTGYEAALDRLSGGARRSVVVHLLSKDELEPSLEGDLELRDSETGELVQVSIDGATKARHEQWLREWFDGVEAYCARRGITYVRTDTSQPIEDLLLGRFQRERVVG